MMVLSPSHSVTLVSFQSNLIRNFPQDPNALNLTMPGGLAVSSRVLRRSEKEVAADRFETSEFMQQVFEADDPGM